MSMQNNIPQLRFQEFEGEIKEMKFGKVVQSNIYGPRFNANDYSDVGNVKTIRGTDLGSDGEIKYDQVPLALLDEKMVNTHKLLEGDIVMITTAECGATGVFRKQEIDFLSSAYGVRLRLNEKGYPYYFKYFFQTHQAKKEINSYIRKSTIANLPGSDILRIKVFLPSLPEQQKIATFLSAVDEKIQQLTRKATLLEHYKKGVMQQLFSGKLRFKDENGEDYADWEEKKLGELSKITTGKLDANAMVQDGEYRFYTCAKDYFRIDKFAFDTEALLISGNGANVGYIHYYKGKFNAYQRTYVLDRIKENIIYLKFYLDNFLYGRIHTEKKEGNTPYIVMSTLSEMEILLPSLAEQQKIANFLSGIDSKIENVNQQLAQTQTFKKGLLQQMFC